MSNTNAFIIDRTLNAPRNLVWQVWTSAEHLAKWFSPTGFTTTIHQLNLNPNGILHYSMTSPEGFTMWGKWIFREIQEPTKLVLIQHFSDEQGGLSRHPGSATWPAYTLSTMTLTEENGKTRLQLEWQPHDASPEEIATFMGAFDSMNQGWGGTFANLEHYLALMV